MQTIQFGQVAVPCWYPWGYLQQPGVLRILDTVLDIVLDIVMAVAVTTAETPMAEALRGEVDVANSGKARSPITN
jgi:hypothetical protein